jgi:hypothetical protein
MCLAGGQGPAKVELWLQKGRERCSVVANRAGAVLSVALSCEDMARCSTHHCGCWARSESGSHLLGLAWGWAMRMRGALPVWRRLLGGGLLVSS